MRLLGIICVSVLALALAMPAYAETQNVKVSGDITLRGVYRSQFDLNKSDNEADSDQFGMSAVEVQIDADLTDNVSTVIRLVNQRNWGDSDYPHQRHHTSSGGTYEIYWKSRLTEVGVDLAHVVLKEMIFEPLTLTIGRQDIWFGKGLIIGANRVDPGFIGNARMGGSFLFPVAGDADQWAIGAPELTVYNAFDAVRATIDLEQYGPVVVDVVYAKIDEGMVGPGEDVDLIGVNTGYTFDVYNGEAEAYYWFKRDDEIGNNLIGDQYDDNNETHLLGARGSFEPNSEWYFDGELAYQFGSYTASAGQRWDRNRHAWALDASTEYRGWEDREWSPKVGAEYMFFSGDNDIASPTGRYQAWDPMFRGHFPMAIRPWLGTYYITDRHPTGLDSGLTNEHSVIVSGSVQPLDDLTFEAKGASYWFDERPDAALYANSDYDNAYIGSEINLITTYDYTEDVTFELLSGWFFPGDHYDSQDQLGGSLMEGIADLNPQIASEVVGTMKVSF